MASLPEGWEFDYDGHRWFYRYKPSGVVQYQFPKPGDEFPEFIDAFSPPPTLAPEEKLESQHQVKRRSTAGEIGSKTNGQRRNAGSGGTLFESDEAGAGGSWFQPDSFMYLGPGTYNDVSPEQDEEYGPGDTPGSRPAVSPPVTVTHAERLNISPMASSQGTPQVANSQPITLANTPVMVNQSMSLSGVLEAQVSPPISELDVDPLTAQQHGRHPAVYPPTVSPVGHMAELYSDLAVQCREESHPPPVELPSGNMMGGPMSFGNGTFDIAPVELPVWWRDKEWLSQKSSNSQLNPISPSSNISNPSQRSIRQVALGIRMVLMGRRTRQIRRATLVSPVVNLPIHIRLSYQANKVQLVTVPYEYPTKLSSPRPVTQLGIIDESSVMAQSGAPSATMSTSHINVPSSTSTQVQVAPPRPDKIPIDGHAPGREMNITAQNNPNQTFWSSNIGAPSQPQPPSHSISADSQVGTPSAPAQNYQPAPVTSRPPHRPSYPSSTLSQLTGSLLEHGNSNNLNSQGSKGPPHPFNNTCFSPLTVHHYVLSKRQGSRIIRHSVRHRQEQFWSTLPSPYLPDMFSSGDHDRSPVCSNRRPVQSVHRCRVSPFRVAQYREPSRLHLRVLLERRCLLP
ncbi:hypothetical protein GE09DRAFT_1215681 [Coniochaeta sp. 2T2.1]|nr:hypothetical protein GE09DRAFT_1215681 [Coniochaeta sp. 2T2.1]